MPFTGDEQQATLLRGGTVLTCDPHTPDLLTGDIRIDGGQVSNLASTVLPRPGDRVIDVTGTIVFPGLVDAHQHLWESPFALQRPNLGLAQYFAEFVTGAAAAVDPQHLHDIVLTALRSALREGVTTTFDWCHATNTPEHAAASIDAARLSGSRYVFGYGPPVALDYYRSDKPHPTAMEGVAASVATDSLIHVAAALRGPDLSPWETCVEDIRRARESGLVVSMHVGTRASGPGGVQSLADHGMLGPDLHVVHGTDSTLAELHALSDAGATLVVPPLAELMMGTGSPPLRRAAAADLPVALGVDTVLGVPPGMFAQMRAALQCLRDGAWDAWDPPSRSTCRDVLTSATLYGAQAAGLSDETGSLVVGKSADVVVMEALAPPNSLDQAYAQVVWNGHASRVRMVLVAGHQVVGPGQFDTHNTKEISQ